MGQLYVLRLRGNKWYVGYTDRGSMDRILEHIEKKGARWTKAHPPLKKGYLHNFTTPGKTRADEDKYTLSLMKKHGIRNVRGGKWCMVDMRPATVRQIERLIGKGTSAKTRASVKPKPRGKPKPKARQKSHRCKAKTVYGQGPRCKLTASPGSDYCRVHAPYYPKKRTRRR